VRIERLRQDYDISVQWVFFPLHPETPSSGRALEELFAGRGYDLEAMYQRMHGLMTQEGLAYGRRTHTYNSRLAQELATWAAARPERDRLHDLIYRAYFVDGRDIGDVGVLVDLAETAGLPADETRDVLEQRTWSDAVDADWARASRSGITGVPTFAAGARQVVGAQPEPVLRQLLEAAGVQPRPTTRAAG